MRPGSAAALFGVLLGLMSSDVASGGGCRFPESWRGRWFQSGIPQPVVVNASTIDSKGSCLEAEGDKYLFQDGDRNYVCYRCVVIYEKHHNVLQYKESLCEQPAPLDALCATIPGDALLYSMFRLGAEPVACPFKGPYTFTYSRGYGECRNPVSRVDQCTQDSRLLLRYQACPDVQKSESTVEELVCLASWKDGSTRYLLGRLEHQLASSDEDRYRCFVWERWRGGSGGSPGYLLAQSGDATCNGVNSATEGSRTMRLTRVEHHQAKCRYPWWLAQHHHWHSLDGRLSLTLNHRNTTLRIASDNPAAIYPASESTSTSSSSSGEVRVVCHMRLDATGIGALPPAFTGADHLDDKDDAATAEGEAASSSGHGSGSAMQMQVTLVAHLTKGCESGYVCMRFYRRDGYVVEVQKGSASRVSEEACLPSHFNPSALPFTTLIAASPQTRRCPFLGRYTVTGMVREGRRASRDSHCDNAASDGTGAIVSDNTGGVGQLTVGCSTHDTMEFHPGGCTGGASGDDTSSAQVSASSLVGEPAGTFACHGSWTEGQTHFLIASPLSRSSTGARRLCFAAAQVGRSGLRFASVAGACLRPSPQADGTMAAAAVAASSPLSGSLHAAAGAQQQQSGHSAIAAATGLFAFNLTSHGQCNEDAGDAASGSGANWWVVLVLAWAPLVMVARGR